jgi:hypothetical protein
MTMLTPTADSLPGALPFSLAAIPGLPDETALARLAGEFFRALPGGEASSSPLAPGIKRPGHRRAGAGVAALRRALGRPGAGRSGACRAGVRRARSLCRRVADDRPDQRPRGCTGVAVLLPPKQRRSRQPTRHRQRVRTITSSPTPSNCRARSPCAACSMNSPANARCRRQRRPAPGHSGYYFLDQPASVQRRPMSGASRPSTCRLYAATSRSSPNASMASRWSGSTMRRRRKSRRRSSIDWCSSTSTKTPTSTVPPTNWRRARPMPTKPLAARWRASRREFGRGDHFRARRHRGHQPGSQDLGQAEHRRRRRNRRLAARTPRQHRPLAATRRRKRGPESGSSRSTTRARFCSRNTSDCSTTARSWWLSARSPMPWAPSRR